MKQAQMPQVDRKGDLRIKTMVATPTSAPGPASVGSNARLTPMSGAIPSPPRKDVKIDFQCPTTAAPPATSINGGGMSSSPATNTAAAPLATSPTNTSVPVRRPTFQNTLAVPARVLPVLKMSTPLVRPARWAKGNAPSA
jgi:hypothetical protein